MPQRRFKYANTFIHRCRHTLLSLCWASLKSICMLHIGEDLGWGSVFVPYVMEKESVSLWLK